MKPLLIISIALNLFLVIDLNNKSSEIESLNGKYAVEKTIDNIQDSFAQKQLVSLRKIIELANPEIEMNNTKFKILSLGNIESIGNVEEFSVSGLMLNGDFISEEKSYDLIALQPNSVRFPISTK
jgi:hypothetical protein